MLTRKSDIIRYYVIDMRYLEHIMHTRKKSKIILARPTQWKYFLRGIFKLDDDLAFIRLSDNIVREFHEGNIIARDLGDGRIKINAHTPIKIEAWTLINVIKFCLEGLQYGTFQRLWLWRW